MRTEGFKIIRCLSGNFHVECLEITNMIRYNFGYIQELLGDHKTPASTKPIKRIVTLRAVITPRCHNYADMKTIYDRRMAN